MYTCTDDCHATISGRALLLFRMELFAGAFVGVEPLTPDQSDGDEEWDIDSAEPHRAGEWVLSEKRKEELRQTRTFRKIQQDIQDRARRRMKRVKEDKKSRLYLDEFYVDKSRQIATMSAEKDLKGHILKHRGHMMKSKSTAESDIMKVKTLVSQAAYELRLGTAEAIFLRFCLSRKKNQ